MAIFWDYIKGVEGDWTDSSGNFHEGGTCLTKIIFNKDEKPKITTCDLSQGGKERDWGYILTSQNPIIETDLTVKGNLEILNKNAIHSNKVIAAEIEVENFYVNNNTGIKTNTVKVDTSGLVVNEIELNEGVSFNIKPTTNTESIGTSINDQGIITNYLVVDSINFEGNLS